MNARTCTHTKIRVHVLTSIEAERGREREKERVKRRRKEEEKREEERREDARSATTQFTMARHGTIYSPEAATFFRISTTTSGTMIASPKHTYTHTYTHIHIHTLAKRFSRESFLSIVERTKFQRHRPDERRITGERSGDRSADSSRVC